MLDRLLDRMILHRADGSVYLDRRRLIRTPWFRVFLHRMDAPDPGHDLHDHPWPFVSVVLRGGYSEYKAETRAAVVCANIAEARPETAMPGVTVEHRPFRPYRMRIDECHRIFRLARKPTWTLVIAGRRLRRWGFYVPTSVSPFGYVDEAEYDRMDRRESVTTERPGQHTPVR